MKKGTAAQSTAAPSGFEPKQHASSRTSAEREAELAEALSQADEAPLADRANDSRQDHVNRSTGSEARADGGNGSKSQTRVGGLSAFDLMAAACGDSGVPSDEEVARRSPFRETGDDFGDDTASVDAAGSSRAPARAIPPKVTHYDDEPSDMTPKGYQVGDYELKEMIGRGGMGVVYRALQKSLGREVAVKLITAGCFADKKSRQRFRREAENAARLQHPNIVSVIEVGVDKGQPFFSMEHIEGDTLADLLKDGPLPWRRACELVLTLAETVAFAHDAGVLHRDLKPGNVMIDNFGRPRITDFGLSADIESPMSLTMTGQFLGTPDYTPLEQILGQKANIGVRSEVYSLGAILYASLTGQPPYRCRNIPELVDKQRSGAVAPPLKLNRSIPRDLDTVILKCLETNVDARYGSVSELAEELRRVLNDEPVKARAISPALRILRWTRRNPFASATIMLLVLLAGVSTAAYFYANESFKSAEERRVEAEYSGYIAQVGLAAARAAQGAYEQARQALLETEPRLRHWEWGRIYSLAHSPERVLKAHTRAIMAADLSRDDKVLLSGGRDNTARIFRLPSGTNTRTFQHDAIVRSVVLSPGAKYAATGGEFPGVRIWSVETGKPYRWLKAGQAQMHSLAYAPDGDFLASGGDDGIIRLWQPEMATVAQILYRGSGDIVSLAFAADSRLLAAGRNDGRVLVFNVETSKLEHEFEFEGWRIAALRFDKDGKRLAVATWNSQAIVLDVASGKRQLTVEHSGPVTCVWFSPDNTELLSGSVDGTVRITNLRTGVLQRVLSHHNDFVTHVSMTSDGKSIFTASYDQSVKITPRQPDSKTRSLPRHEGGVRDIAFLGDGRRILTAGGDGDVILSDAVSGREQHRFTAHTDVETIDVSAGDRLIAAGLDDGLVKIWDVKSKGQELVYRGHRSRVWSVDFAPEGTEVLTASQDGSSRIWDALTGQERKVLHNVGPSSAMGPTRAVFSPQGKYIAVGRWNGLIDLLDRRSGELIREIRDRGRVRDLAFSSDESRLFSASDDNTLKVFDVANGRLLQTLSGHSQIVRALAVFPDWLRVASVSGDGTAKIWDTQSGRELLSLSTGPNGLSAIAYSPTLRSLVTGDWEGNTTVWLAEDWDKSIDQLTQTRMREDRLRRISSSLFAQLGQQAVYSPTGTSEMAGRSELVYHAARNQAELPRWFEVTLRNEFDETLTGTVDLEAPDNSEAWSFFAQQLRVQVAPSEEQALRIPLPEGMTPEEFEARADVPRAVWNLWIGSEIVWKDVTMPVFVDAWPYQQEMDLLRGSFRPQIIGEQTPFRDRPMSFSIKRRNPLGLPITETLEWKLPNNGLWTAEPSRLALQMESESEAEGKFTMTFRGNPDQVYPLPVLRSVVELEGNRIMVNQSELPLDAQSYFRRYQPTAEALRVGAPPRIDGRLDDPAWQGPVTVSTLLLADGSGLPQFGTKAKLRYDDDNLYIALRMTESQLAKLAAPYRKRDRFSNEQDAVELFFSPRNDTSKYFQIVLNSAEKAGAVPQIYDIRYDRADNRNGLSWNGDFEARAGREAQAWTIELRLPWRTIELEGGVNPGRQVDFQLVRTRAVSPWEKSHWVPNFLTPHQPDRWGILRLK